jgi:branched-subunit amino acid aminotransferase/4-amino-4-deoxychorismate lyase
MLLVKNGVAEVTQLTFKAFVSSFPRGAYTTARTHGLWKVFEYDDHVKRLAQSVSLMMSAEEWKQEGLVRLTKVGELEPLVRRECGVAIREYVRRVEQQGQGQGQGMCGEMKLTMLVSWHEMPVTVQIRGHPRQNAKAKDSQWVLARQDLERAMEPGSNEMLLSDDAGNITEGLSSNFFAVKYLEGGEEVERAKSMGAPRPFVLYTSTNVLDGTVRKIVFMLSERLGFPIVVDRCLNIWDDIRSWDECFVSSTSRLVLPIGKVKRDEDGAEFTFGCAVGNWLNSQVEQQMDSVSRSVVDEVQ